jgi:hypothetical protein
MNQPGFDRMVGYNTSAFKGRYYHSGSGFVSDALSQVIPLLKNYSRKKLGHFASNLASELGQGGGIRKSIKRSAGSTVKSVLKDLTGGKPRRRKTTVQTKKKKTAPKKKKRKYFERTKADFFSQI